MKNSPNFFKQFSFIIFLTGFFFLSNTNYAKEKKWQSSLSGSDIQQNAVVVAQDVDSACSSYVSTDEATFVELKVDDLLGPFNWYRYAVNIGVTPILSNGTLGTQYFITLSVDSNKLGGTMNFVDLRKHKVLNSRGASVRIISIENKDLVTGVITTTTPNNVSITVSYETNRFYNFNSSNAPSLQYTTNTTTNELQVSWLEICGAEEYELAWTWVDNYGSAYGTSFTTLTTSQVFLGIKEFEGSCTRIQTKGLNYTIPLVYDNGYLVFRIRAIGRFPTDTSKRLYGRWNITPIDELGEDDEPLPIQVSKWLPANIRTTTGEAILTSKNWQFQSSYAEEGKRKSVVSYFDGSLRNRQTVTKINTDGKIIVGETIYDEEGRPAIEVLPSPSSLSSLKYNMYFSQSAATPLSTNKVYSYQDFLHSSSAVCDLMAVGMRSDTPLMSASRYYASGNSLGTNQDFVPVADKFPFSQTEYSSDNTGRIKRKGGVGLGYQLGSNREMKYFYSVPAQHELNRLFGYNVGLASHYKKNIVIDPNKQVSVAYIDPQGRTVATALGGDAPLGMEPLHDSDSIFHPTFKTDLLNKLVAAAADTDLDNNYRTSTGNYGVLMDRLSFSAQKVFTENSGTYTFDYTMNNPSVFNKFCSTQTYTYPFMYVLKRKVMDECGNTASGTFINDIRKVGTYSSTGTGFVGNNNNFMANTIFQLTLPSGAYEVSKELTVDTDALEVFVEDYIARGKASGCILPGQSPNASIDGCFKTCESCTTYYTSGIKFTPAGGVELSGQQAYVEMKLASNYDYLQIENPTEAEENLFRERFIREHVLLLEACNDPCKKDGYIIGNDQNASIRSMNCDNSLDLLMTDMMPNGQYGVYPSEVDEDGNVILGNSDIEIGQLPLSVYNDNMVATQGLATNQIHSVVNGIDPTKANWRNPHYYDVFDFISDTADNNEYKHYYTPSGGIDYLPITWNPDEQTFEPALLEEFNNPESLMQLGSDLVVESAEGMYKVEPQYLANVEDFITAIGSRKNWALSLVKYHPEFHYLDYVNKACKINNLALFEVDPATSGKEQITLNSDGLDALLGSVKTYAEAKTAGFLDSALSLYTIDPFFQKVHPLDAQITTGLTTPSPSSDTAFREQKQSIMKNALEASSTDPNLPNGRYENTGFTMAYYIFKTIKCNGLDYNCPAGTSGLINNFLNIRTHIENINNFSVAERDLFWQYYVSYYVGLKQKISSVFINTHAIRQGFYNDCIGNENSENINKITEVINKYPIQKGIIADWAKAPSSPAMTLLSKNGVLLKGKEKRFQPFDELYNSEESNEQIYQGMKDDAGSYYLATTGNCPRINEMTIFLDNFLRQRPTLLGTTTPFVGNYLTPDLFKALGGNYNQTPPEVSGNFEPDTGDLGVTVSIDAGKLKIQLNQINPPNASIAPIVLTVETNASSWPWSTYNNAANANSGWKILQVTQMAYSPPPVSGTYSFKFLATVKNNVSAVVSDIVISGTTKAVLACSTNPATAAAEGSVYVPPFDGSNCSRREDFAKALKDLIVNLQLSQSLSANGLNISGNTTFKNGYLPEFFGISPDLASYSWSKTPSNDMYYINAYTTIVADPSPFPNEHISLKRAMRLHITMPSTAVKSLTISPEITSTDYGDGNIVTITDTNGIKFIGYLYSGEAIVNNQFNESSGGNTVFIATRIKNLNFTCCGSGSYNANSASDLKQEYFETLKTTFNSVLESFESAFLNNDCYVNGNSCLFSIYSSLTDELSPFYNNTLLKFTTVNFYQTSNIEIRLNITNNQSGYLKLNMNSFLNRISTISSDNLFFEQGGTVQVTFTDGTTGSFEATIVPVINDDYYKCPCIPQAVEPVACKPEYDEYVQHLASFGIANNLAQVNTTVPAFNYSSQQVFCGLNYQTIWKGYKDYLQELQITSTEHPHYISLPSFGATALNYGYKNYGVVIDEFDAYLTTVTATNRIYLGANSIYYTGTASIPADLDYELVDTWVEYAAYYVYKEEVCPPEPMIPTISIRVIRNSDCLDYSRAVNETYNEDAYATYIDSLKDAFRREYLENALSKVVETFSLTYSEKEYQYTLYYYDQAGNLIQTVAPEGVQKFNLYANPNLNNNINSHRKTNSGTDNPTYLPNHGFKTQYRYNSLNQLVWQSTPDGGEMRFAYDKLGRIVASQNSNQILSLINNPKFTLSSGLKQLENGAFIKDVSGTNWIGGNTSTALLPGSGYVQYTIHKESSNGTLNNGVIVGLSYANVTGDASSVRYAFRVVDLNTVYTRQNTADATTGLTLYDGDVLKIERLNNKIRWYRNTQLLLEVSEASPGAAMLVDLAISINMAEIRDLKIVRYDLKDKFSYTRYDALGRIHEAGQMDANSLLAINDNGRLVYQSDLKEVLVDPILNNFPHNISSNQIEVTKTLYDTYSTSFNPDDYLSSAPRHTRNRVTAILTYDSANASTPLPNFETAIFYNYDIHGNVNEMVQALSPSVMDVNGSSIKKRVNYEYDLISGNVHKVFYQKNSQDQFIHRYNYDADNRITDVQTSKDNVIWETDATYKYYDHGPLARVILGDKKVQGIDYAYTLQGWLKTVNSESLANDKKDMGNDGNVVSKDAFGYSLSYNKTDYKPKAPGLNQAHSLSPSNTNFEGTELFNGNISRMITSLRESNNEDVLPTQVNRYKYDQLNRIFSMVSFKGQEGSGAAFTSSYSSSYSYDRNGNLKTLKRTAPRINPDTQAEFALPQPMDDFTYNYETATNKLKNIVDAVPSTHFGSATENIDIDTQVGSNYAYDGIGQLILDKGENIQKIFWRVDGKVKSVQKDDGRFINFYYDGLGNRVAKNVVLGSSKVGTHYARDAQGNVLGVYDFVKQAIPIYDLREHHIYGSSRLGLQAYDNYQVPANFERVVGDKRYELANHLGNVLSVVDDKKVIESNMQVLASDTFDSNVGAWSALGTGATLQFDSQTKSLRVIASSELTGAKREVALNAGSKVVMQCKVGRGSAGSVFFEVKQGTNLIFSGQIVDNDNTMAVFTAPVSGSYTVSVVLGSPVPYAMFTIDNFYVYRLPQIPTDHISLFVPNVLSYNDYYPFGMLVPRRHSSDDYRYGFQGQEKDDEIKGDGNSLNYTFRMHDPRVGRFFARDPLTKEYPHYTPYSFSGNKVIAFTELEGMEEKSIHIKVSPVDSFWNELKGWFGMDYFDYHPEDAQTTEATSNLVSKQKDALTRTAKATETIETANYVMVGMVASPFIIYGTAAGLAYASPFIATEFGSLAMADASGYFGAAIWQTSGRTALFNGLANATGQIVSNDGFDNFNYAQPLFASAVGNPFLSNLGESSFFMGFDENGEFAMKANNFDSNFIGTFGSNYLGSKIGAKFETPSSLYKPARNALDFIIGGAVETFENKIGDGIKTTINTLSDFKIDKSFNREKKTNSF